MTTKVDRKIFLNNIEKVSQAANREIEKNLIFSNGFIIGVSESLVIHSPIEEGITGVVPAQELIKILSSIESNKVKISSNDKHFMIKASGVDAKLKMTKDIEDFENEINFVKEIEVSKFKKLPRGFNDGLKLCLFSASIDKSQIAINGIWCTKDKIMSTDDIRLGKYTMMKKLKKNFFLPLNNAAVIAKSKLSLYFCDDKWVHFIDKDNATFSSRLVVSDEKLDEFPNDSAFEIKGNEVEFPKEIIKMLDVSTILADGDLDFEKEIKINFKGSRISCTGSNEIGEVTAKGRIKNNKKSITISINPVFLKEIFSKFKLFTAIVGEDRVLFETENFKSVLAQWITE